MKAIAPDVLRHRVLTTYEAEAEEVTSDDIVHEDSRDRRGAVTTSADRRCRIPMQIATPISIAHRRPRVDIDLRRMMQQVAVPPEVLRQVRLIELRTRRLVNSLFAGEYRSIFKGQGMEFAEVREYQPGDEVRSHRLERDGAHADGRSSSATSRSASSP